MRIGVDAGCWANDRGYGRFAREMLSELVDLAPDDEFVFFLDPASRAVFELAGKNVIPINVKQSVSPSEAAAADGSRSPLDMLRFTAAVRRARLDVFFSPSVYTYFPLPPGLKAVVGIHDAIAERFPELTLPSKRARLFWAAKVWLAVFQARLILSVSEFAASDVSRVIGVDRSRIRVAVEAPAPAFRPRTSDDKPRSAVARQYGMSEKSRWFTYVGGFNPHKNVDALVDAFGSAVESEDDSQPVYLILVGKVDGDVFHGNIEDIRRVIDQRGLRERVIWAGFVPDDDLRLLHSDAVALVLPSECEGFGLPAVEAAACGTPVIATTESPLPQLLDGGGIFVDPGAGKELTSALRKLLTDVPARDRMARTALGKARELSWRRCAEETLSAIREAAA